MDGAEKSKAGLYRSDNGGESWTMMSNDQLITSRSWYYMEVYADTKNENVVYVLNAPMTKSIDGGKTLGESSIEFIMDSCKPAGVTFFQFFPPSVVRYTKPQSLPVHITPFSNDDSVT